MKFSDFKIKDALDKSALKFAVVVLSMVSLLFSILLAIDFSKEAIVVERGCESKIASVSSVTQTKEEIENFLIEAIHLRFDSSAVKDASSYLAQDLFVARVKEQDELKSSKIDQRLIVRKITPNGGHFLVDVDRLIAAGKARSAIPLSLVVKISSKSRSITNPYGLVITSIEQISEEKKNVE